MSLTATFKAIFNLTVETTGAGVVTLSPSGRAYENGTRVTLTASPAAGYQFAEWRDGLFGSTNPATIVMNANKRVTAVFTAIQVAHEETQTGGSSNSTTVTTSGSLTAGSGQLYLAAISTKPHVKVDVVSGLGLSWMPVKAQCSGRNSSGIKLWMAHGTPSGDDEVTATFDSAPNNAVIAVSRYSGTATVNPVGNVISGNTKGQNGACSDGVDDKSYLFNLPTTIDGAAVYGATAMRSRSHVPGTGFTERAEINYGSNSAMAAIAVLDKVVPSATTVTINGAFNGEVDWAVVAVEIKPENGILLPVDSFNDKTTGASPAPSAFLLHNYPNPFNAQTNIEYTLSKPGQARLSIYNLNGQR
ncbi:MAG: InlB B-repeat-containing protein, partial [bacterium]